MAAQLKVSRTTVTVVYERLNAEGYITSRVGAGTFVSTGSLGTAHPRRAPKGSEIKPRAFWLAPPPPPQPRVSQVRFNFMPGVPDVGLFPFDIWRRIVGRILSPEHSALGRYQSSAGQAVLRTAIARHIGIARSVHASPDDVLVTHGTQQALDLIARVLIEPGDCVAIENPGYTPARRLFQSHGARVVATPLDEEGICVSELPDDARIVYTTPSHQFPLGMAMSISRRGSLLQWAAEHGAVIIEDDYDSEFRFRDRPLDPLQSLDNDGRVIYVGTFSKTLLPTLRIGFMVAPRSLRQALQSARQLTDWHSETVTQTALGHFIDQGHFARHLRKATRIYGERHKQVIASINEHTTDYMTLLPSSTGMHVCTRWNTDSPVRIDRATTLAAEAGISFQTLASYELTPAGNSGLVIGFGSIPLEQIDPGIIALWESFRSGQTPDRR
jgi:GntR family transcriptional regulator/MocR family aminotransferase